MAENKYTVRRSNGPVDWSAVPPLQVDTFFEHSSNHRPQTAVRVVYDERRLIVRFEVADRYVRAVAANYQDPVCRDSCVEFFVQPKPGGRYFNFEVNAGGCLLLYAIPVSPQGESLMDAKIPVPEHLVRDMNIQHSLPSRIDPEMEDPCEWTIEYVIPIELFEHYEGPLRPLAGQTWRANFYKCGDATSHPHWAMWSPVPDGDRFHRPEYFGSLQFEG